MYKGLLKETPIVQPSDRCIEFAQKMADEICNQFNHIEQNVAFSEIKRRILESRINQIESLNSHLEDLIRSKQSLDEI